MRRRDFLLGAVAAATLPGAAFGQSRRRESERRRVEERAQERREERRANEDRADARPPATRRRER